MSETPGVHVVDAELSGRTAGCVTPFCCQGCGKPLRVIKVAETEMRCTCCGWHAGDEDGTFDFVSDEDKAAEAEYYETEYTNARSAAPRDLRSLRQLWVRNPTAPYNELILRRMEGIADKTVVVLGCGSSPRELYFLEQQPNWLVMSDLSKAPLGILRDTYTADHPPNLIYAAIDAEHLPFADQSVDVVYGYAFVHHLPDHRWLFGGGRPGARTRRTRGLSRCQLCPALGRFEEVLATMADAYRSSHQPHFA